MATKETKHVIEVLGKEAGIEAEGCMMLVRVTCDYCGARCQREARDVNRAKSRGARVFCDRMCAGLSRRKNKTKAQMVADKAAYDALYRERNHDELKAKKADYFRRTYDPATAAVVRKARMPKHVEYCRQPKYRAWKQQYDKGHRAKKQFGPFADVAMLAADLNLEIKQRASNHEVKYENQSTNKAQRRRRESKEGKERGRNSRRSDQAAVS